MRHRKTTKSLGRKRDPRRALIKGLSQNLVLHEKIKTTYAKAKVLRPHIERMVTTAKKGDLTARRQLIKKLTTDGAVNKMLEVIGPRYKTRAGGYTRIVKIGPRKGDGAEIVQIEFV
jgi:large subunit ribosomal protein L17